MVEQEFETSENNGNLLNGLKSETFKNYLKEYKASLEPEYWGQIAVKNIEWIKLFQNVTSGSFESANVKWFVEGTLNACQNCVDRHLKEKSEKIALLWEGDDEKVRKITFKELHQQVCAFAAFLKSKNVQKGDAVCIYMPMIPEAVYAMLACARIGAVHSVVFGGFSSEALRDRIVDCKCKVVICADFGYRGGKTIPLKKYTEEAVCSKESLVKHVLVFYRAENSIENIDNRFESINSVFESKTPKECPVEEMNSEDPLFILYTSGSTGKPKGLVHSTGGYLVYASETHRRIFDVKENDVFGCVADVGWITGHTYVVYGPLLNGVTTLLFESTPLYPDASRYWKMVEKHKLTQFYTSPTAIRAVQKFGEKYTENVNLSSLRVLGSVGEPINKEAWQWYYKHVGRGKIPIVDTYWQTETGGIIVTPLPNVTPLKTGSASFPFFGIEPVVIDPLTHNVVEDGKKGVLCVKNPWPGVARTVLGNHKAYKKIYLEKFPGYYYTGDGALKDQDGYHYIIGRVDDVLSISGHRIGTAEIETAITKHSDVVECAVIGVLDEIRGQKWIAFIIKKNSESKIEQAEIKNCIKSHVGSFASFGRAIFVQNLPKTRSGKIMRRILRKIVAKEQFLGDLSTLNDPTVIEDLQKQLNLQYFDC